MRQSSHAPLLLQVQLERHIKAESADITALGNVLHRVRSSHDDLEARHAKLSQDYQSVLQKKVDRDRQVRLEWSFLYIWFID